MMTNAIRKGYTTIKELPSEVRSSFDERDQEKWMEAYNKASESKDPDDAKVDAWMSMVDAPSSLAVETWGSVEVRDSDGELVPVDTIAEYADKFIENGGLMHDSHSNVPVGTVWDWEIRKHPDTGQDGVVFYFNIYRDGEVFERARDDILSGRKQAVSIGAEAPRGGYKCDDRGCYVERDVTDLYELSICETPANPEAYFINVGKDIAKSKQPMDGEVFRIGIKDMVVHQDYTTCPLQKVKHDLLGIGFKNVHIKDDTVVAKSVKNEYKLFKAISRMGHPFCYDLKKQEFEIIPDYTLEHAIDEALDNGWAHQDQIGHICLTKEIPKEVFIDWYDRGFITKIGDFYCLKADDVAKDSIGKMMQDEFEQMVGYRVNDNIYNEIEWVYMNCPQFKDKQSIVDYWNEHDYAGIHELYVNAQKSAKKSVVAKSADIKPYYHITGPDGMSVESYLGTLPFNRYNESNIHQGIADLVDELFKHRGEFDVDAVADYISYLGLSDAFEAQKEDVFNGTRSPLTFILENKDYIVSMEGDYLTSTEFTEYQGRDLPADEYGNPPRHISWLKTPLYAIKYMGLMDDVGKAKKKVVKDGGAMGVGDAGATNAVYGSKPTSLTNPDKKYGKKRKTKKELNDDGNIRGPTPIGKTVVKASSKLFFI